MSDDTAAEPERRELLRLGDMLPIAFVGDLIGPVGRALEDLGCTDVAINSALQVSGVMPTASGERRERHAIRIERSSLAGQVFHWWCTCTEDGDTQLIVTAMVEAFDHVPRGAAWIIEPRPGLYGPPPTPPPTPVASPAPPAAPDLASPLRSFGVVGTNSGHGHAWERPDGVKARCGGPGLCARCSAAQRQVDALVARQSDPVRPSE